MKSAQRAPAPREAKPRDTGTESPKSLTASDDKALDQLMYIALDQLMIKL